MVLDSDSSSRDTSHHDNLGNRHHQHIMHRDLRLSEDLEKVVLFFFVSTFLQIDLWNQNDHSIPMLLLTKLYPVALKGIDQSASLN